MMLMILYEYVCNECGCRHEQFADNNTVVWDCPCCDGVSRKVISAPHLSLDPISGDFPTTTQNWLRSRETKITAERKDSNYDPVLSTLADSVN